MEMSRQMTLRIRRFLDTLNLINYKTSAERWIQTQGQEYVIPSRNHWVNDGQRFQKIWKSDQFIISCEIDSNY